MSTAIVVADQRPDYITGIIEAARDPKTDAEKTKVLWTVAKDMLEHEAKTAFNKAFIAARKEMLPIVKDAENKDNHTKFAKLETIDRGIRPICEKYGFVFSFGKPVERAGDRMVTLGGELIHEGGYSKSLELTAGIDDVGIRGTANKTNVQGVVSTTSYLKRVLKTLAFDLTLVNTDQDGISTAVIDAKQVNQVFDMFVALESSPESQRKFLDAVGARRVEDIPAHQFARVMTALQAKLRQKEGR